jgi:hypothetical protein
LAGAFFYSETVSKRKQFLMANDSDQARLNLPRKPLEVDLEAVRRQPSMTKAIVLCADLAGLKNDKDQARAIDVDATTWSLIKDGKRAFPHESYETLFDEFGNEAPLIWLADRRGYVLTPKESELEKRLRLTRERAEKAEEREKMLIDILQGRAK